MTPGELRLVAHPQQQAGEDDHEAGRRHEGVELGDLGQIDPQILRRRAADPLGDARRDRRSSAGSLSSRLEPAISCSTRSYCCHMPCSSLSVGRWPGPISGLIERGEIRASAAPARPTQQAQPRPPSSVAAGERQSSQAHCRARTWRPAFIRPSSRSTICAAPSGVRMSPNWTPGSMARGLEDVEPDHLAGPEVDQRGIGRLAAAAAAARRSR